MSLRSTPSQRSICSPIEIHKMPNLDAASCPILNVVVYPEKAEVTRKVNVQVKEGLTQIKITNVSKCVEPATIRVLTLSNSILNEVNFATKTVLDCAAAGDTNKLDQLKQQQAHMLKELNDLEVKEHTLKKQREVLEAFANRIISSKKPYNDESLDALSLSSLDMITKFLPMYEEQSTKISDGFSEIKEQRGVLDKKLKEVTQDINSTDPAKDGILSREIHILVEAYEEEEVKLLVSYVVGEAGWAPKYDLRVHTRDKNLKVLYFGVVSQNTGEPWTDARISLSTATPSTGGLPALGTHELYSRTAVALTPSLKRAHRGTSVRRKKSEKNIKLPPPSDCIEEDTATDITKATVNGIGDSEENLATVDFDEPAHTEPANKIMAISTTYATAAEDVTIPSDKSGHKVHIAKIDLPAAFYYASCPRVCPHAFLHITARNDSAYALLAGSADIFLDGNFCTKTIMKDVCPTEDFEIDVGSDPTIKVIYRPLLRHKETGSKTHLISYTQDMDLKNGRRDGPINIVVTDQLPKSTDDKVKVILHEPDVKKKKETTARLNPNNNIEWNVEIPADSTAKLHLRYSVEYPLYMDVIGLV